MRNRVLPLLLGAALIVGIAASPAHATKGDTATGGGQTGSFTFTFSAKDNGPLGVTGSADVSQLGSGGYHYYGKIVSFSVCGSKARMVVLLAKNSTGYPGYITLNVWDRGEGSNASSTDRVQWTSGPNGPLACLTPSSYLIKGNVQVAGTAF